MESQGIVLNEEQENRPMELTVASVATAALAAKAAASPAAGTETGA
jgi:hypothetical protein